MLCNFDIVVTFVKYQQENVRERNAIALSTLYINVVPIISNGHIGIIITLTHLAKRVSKIIAVKVESEQHKKENEYNDPSSSSSSYTISVNVVCSSQHTFEMK
ncbi:hypothetical protein BLOT_013611 [Blomia tropicalis]|nr:hypothetical protein BLOT_013611 [Blomia tropicalis]